MIAYVGLAVCFVAVGLTAQFYRAKAAVLEVKAERLENDLAASAGRITWLEDRLEAEMTANAERAARLNGSAAGHEELKRELETCDLDSGWSVPGALYERLCRQIPLS